MTQDICDSLLQRLVVIATTGARTFAFLKPATLACPGSEHMAGLTLP